MKIKTLLIVLVVANLIVVPISVAADNEEGSVFPFGHTLVDVYTPAPPSYLLEGGQLSGVNNAPIFKVYKGESQRFLHVWHAKRYTITAMGALEHSALPLPGFEGPWLGSNDPEPRVTEIIGPARSLNPQVMDTDPAHLSVSLCVVHVLAGESYRLEINDYSVRTEVNGFDLNGVRAYFTVGIFEPGRGDPAVLRCDPAYELVH